MKDDAALREEILELLQGPHAHADFEAATREFPFALQGRKPEGSPHTPWEILEHLRLAQRDILDFCRESDYEEPEFPEGYWPKEAVPSDKAAWDRSVRSFLEDRRALEAMVADPGRGLMDPVPDEEGPSLLHEVVIVAAHNSYHLGQLLLLRRAMGA